MKRSLYNSSLSSSDDIITNSIWDKYPKHKEQIDRINAIESQIESTLKRKTRISLALDSYPLMKCKILRTFINHIYIPNTEYEKGHFLVTLEGHLLDKKLMSLIPYGSLFEKINFLNQEKKFGLVIGEKNVAWSGESQPDGFNANCFRLKIYSDKITNIKIFLHRNMKREKEVRFDVSDKLRSLLTSLSTCPTETEIMVKILINYYYLYLFKFILLYLNLGIIMGIY
jgi:hypothetical protein